MKSVFQHLADARQQTIEVDSSGLERILLIPPSNLFFQKMTNSNILYEKYPQLKSFYLLQVGDEEGAYICSMQKQLHFHQRCDMARGVVRLKAPVDFGISGGSKPYSVLSTGNLFLPLIKNSIFEAFIKYGFTGWKSVAAHLNTNQGGLIDSYSMLTVTGRSGVCDLSLSTELESPFAGLPKKAKGYIFDYETWDGSDFFVMGEKAVIPTVSERVASFLLDNDIDNVVLTKILDYEYFARL